MFKKIYFSILTLTALLCFGATNAWGETLTVANGDATNTGVPICGNYADTKGMRSQFIYPSSLLTDMEHGTISKVKFYSSTASKAFTSTFEVRLSEVSASTLSGFNTDGGTKVYTGSLTLADNEMEISFDTPYEYNGDGNLLFDIEVTANTSAWVNAAFYGITQSGAGYSNKVNYGGAQVCNLLPKVTFTYTPGEPPTCPKPKNLNMTDMSSASASFAWTKGDAETSWQYICLPAATAVDWSDAGVKTATSATATVTGLTAQTSYKFYVRAYCESTDQSAELVKVFKTPCAGESLPWDCGFESSEGYSTGSYSSAAPTCWDILNANQGAYPYIYISTSYAKSGNGLYFQSSKSKYGYIILPPFEHGLDVLKLSFSHKEEGTSSTAGQITVGYMTDPADEDSFVPVQVCTRVTSHTTISDILFTDAPSYGRIAFRYGGGTGDQWYAGIDDIHVEATIDCSKPATPTYSDLTGSSVTINWTANAGVDDYKYINVDRTATPDYVLDWENDATLVESATSVDLEGLTDGHNYEFYVMCACGTVASDACTYQPLSCATPTNVQFTNQVWNGVTVTWDAGGVETSWNLEYQQGSLGWVSVPENPLSTKSYTFTNLVTNAVYSFQVQAGCGGDWTPVATYTPTYEIPAPSVSGETDAQATVSWAAVPGADSYEYVVMSGSVAADWTSPESTDETSATLSGLVGGSDYTVYVRSVYGANRTSAGSAAFTTTTVAPSALTKGTVTDGEATYTWSNTGAATQYQWACKASGTPEEADWSSPISVLTATATGLTSNTNYTFYVRAYYAEGKTSAYVSSAFKTDCGAVFALTWEGGNCESSETPIPSCWARIVGSGYTSYPQFYNSSSSAHGGSRSVYFYGGNSGNEEYIILPPFTEATGTLTISLWYKNGSTSTSDPCLYVGYMTDPTDGESFVSKAELTRKTSYTQAEVALTGAPADARIAIKLAGGNGGSYDYSSANVDDIVLSLTPSCPKPKTLTASDVMYDGASFSWIGGEESKWAIEFSTNSADWSEAIVEEITTNPYTKTGLTTGTTYYARVKAICGEEDESDYSNVVSFTPACKTPSTPVLDAKSTNNATISWTANSGEGTWSVQYKKSTDGAWTTVSDVTDNPYTLTGLTSATTYQVKVAACNGIYTSALSFITDCDEKTLPWNCGFEASEGYTTGTSSSSAPICWDLLNANDGSRPYFYVSSDYKKTGSNGLYLSATSARAGFVILPEFDADLTTAQIEFYHKEEDTSSSGHIQLGYLTDIDDAETFVTLHTCGTLSKTEWLYEKVDNLESIPAGARLAFRYIGAISTYYDAYIDDITVSVRPTCVPPTAAEASAITNNSASINWTKGDDETSWKLRYSEDGISWTIANEGNAFTSKPFALDGLDANTTYYVQVMAVCGLGDESPWSASGEFTTDCDAQAMPFEQAFSSTLPSCWRLNTVGDKTWAPSSIQRVSSSYSMSIGVYTEAENYGDLMTPSIVLDEDAELKFQLWNSYNSDPVVGEVYIVVGNVTTKLLDLPATTNFELQTIDLSDYTGSTAKFIFRGHGNGKTNYRYLYIDDVEVKAKPCDAPTALSKVETSSSVTLSWTDEAASKWNLRWREVTEPESSWNNVENLTEKNLSLSTTDGLAFEKTYQAQVQAVCTAVKSSEWSSLISFGLVCGAAPTALTVSARTTNSATLTWEGTESAFKLQTSLDGETWEDAIDVNAKTYNLTSLTAGTTYYARVQNNCGGDYATTSFKTWCGLQDAAELPLNIESFTDVPECWQVIFKGAYSGVAGDKICFYGAEEQWAILPAYDIDLNKLSVTFTYSLTGTADFGYLDEPNGTFHAFASQPASGVELDLAGETSGAKYIAIRYNGTSSMLISGVQLRKTPTCVKPTDVTATPAVGAASIDWTSEAEAWKLQYKTGSAAWSEAINVAAKPYNLTGLAQGTMYKVRVQAACAGEETSDWSDEAEFTTDCDAITSLPYYADFSQALSACWTIYHESSSSYYIPVANTAMNELKMDGGKEGHSNNVVVLPAISADFTNAILSLEYKNSSTDYAKLEVGYMNDKADVSTFIQLEELAQKTSFTEARVALNTVPDGKQLALRFAGASNYSDMTIRNLRVINAYNLADDVNNSTLLGNLNGQTLDVTIGRTFKRANYFNTICLPFSLSEEELTSSPLAGAELWTFKYASVENSELLVRIQQESSLVAGRPYLILFGEGEDLVNPLFKNVTITATAGEQMNYENISFVGTLSPVPFSATSSETYDRLFLKANNTLAWAETTGYVRSFRAYFEISAGVLQGAPIRRGMRARIVTKEEVATGIDEINSQSVDNNIQKVLEGDQVIIIRNGVKYTIQGQVISK